MYVHDIVICTHTWYTQVIHKYHPHHTARNIYFTQRHSFFVFFFRVSWGLLYLLFIHFYFLSMDSTLAELAASHIPVVLFPSTALLPTAVPATTTTAAPGGTGCGVVKRRILPVLYRQTTPTRWGRKHEEKHGEKHGETQLTTVILILLIGSSLEDVEIKFELPRLKLSSQKWIDTVL